MAIEKNSFKSSRLESEFSSHSREMMSSDEEEFQRYNSGAVESEDDDDDEFDDCDSGAGSDDFDLLELGESGEEFCQVGDQTCSIPYELYDLQGLGDVLSMDVWNEVLTEEERFCLTQYLPDMDQETFMRTLKDLLTGCNLHFGNPLNKLFNMLKGGLCEPRVALYRQGLIFFQKHQHYHLLRKYQNVMVNSFCQIRDGWQNCRGYSIEEKLRVLNIMKTQNSYISEKMEEMESDESDREGSGDAFWGKRVKDRKHGQKSARYSGYGMGSAIDLLYTGKQTAAEPAKFGKQNSKGALKGEFPTPFCRAIMAISSSSLSATLFPVCNSSAISAKPKLSFTSLPSNCAKFQPLKTSRLSTSRILAAPEVLDSSADVTATEDEASATSFPDVSFDSDKAAPKHKIRIKLRSYWVPLIEDSCKQIMDAARNTNAKTMGPVPLPTKRRVYCVLKSPHVDKDARFHFEIRTHQRLIDILYPTAQTIDSLMQLDLPAGVDVEVKL